MWGFEWKLSWDRKCDDMHGPAFPRTNRSPGAIFADSMSCFGWLQYSLKTPGLERIGGGAVAASISQ